MIKRLANINIARRYARQKKPLVIELISVCLAVLQSSKDKHNIRPEKITGTRPLSLGQIKFNLYKHRLLQKSARLLDTCRKPHTYGIFMSSTMSETCKT